MKSRRTRVIAFGVAMIALAGCQNKAGEKNGTTLPKTEAKAPAAAAVVDPDAVAALRDMSKYLTSLNTAEIVSNGSIDVVTDAGQRIQLDGVTNYKLRKPGFVIDFKSDLKNRRFYYDGKTNIAPGEQVIFVDSWPSSRTDEEIQAKQKADLARREAAEERRRREFQEIDQSLNRLGI